MFIFICLKSLTMCVCMWRVDVHVCEFINSVGRALQILWVFHQKSQNKNITCLTIIHLRLYVQQVLEKLAIINLGSEDGLVPGDCFLPYSVVSY